MDNLERCGSPIDFRLTDIFVSLKRTNLFFFTDLYLLSNRSWHYISLWRTMSLQTPSRSMQMYCSVTTHPPAVPREDISSLQRSWSEHPDWIRLLEIYFFLLYDKVVLSTSERSDWFFLGRDFAIRHSSLILPKCHREGQQTEIQTKPVKVMHVRVVVFVDSWSLDHYVFN